MDENSLLMQHAPYLGIFLLLILGTFGFPFPEDAILLWSGLLIAQDVMKPLPGLLVVYIGLMATDFLLYSIGRRYGRKLIEHRTFQNFISPARLSLLEGKFEKWGNWVLLTGRLVWGLRAQVLMATGVMRMPWLKFLMTDAVSACLTMTLWVGIGCWGGSHIPVLREDIIRIQKIILIGLAVITPVAVLFRFYKNRFVGQQR
jgi:membrane protein DedA with SNARE-associated domain